MSAFSEKRTEVRAEYAELTKKLHSRLAQAGQKIIESDVLPSEEPYATLTARDREISERIDELRRTHDRIVAVGQRMADIKRAREELEQRHKEIGNELAPHYQTIGENAFRVFRDNPLIDQEYADVFTPLLDAHEEIRQTRADLSRAESELAEKPFLEKMVQRGRIIVLRNRLAMRENHLERLYREAGKQISATNFITTIGDPQLDEAAAPFLDLMDESQRIEREIGSLDDERSALQEEISNLGVAHRPATRIKELDEEITVAEAQRSESLADIATAAKGSDLENELSPEARSALDEAKATEETRNEAQEKLDRLDAALRVEQLSGDLDQIDSSIDRKRKQIASLTTDIEELERQKTGIEEQVKEAEAKRGSVEELLS